MDMSSQELRAWAERCETMAAAAVSADERAVLIKKSEAILSLAESQDWLAGRGGLAVSAPIEIEAMAAE